METARFLDAAAASVLPSRDRSFVWWGYCLGCEHLRERSYLVAQQLKDGVSKLFGAKIQLLLHGQDHAA